MQADFYRYGGEKNIDWVKRMDDQYNKHAKGTNNARIIKFIGWFVEAKMKNKVQEYYQKVDRKNFAFNDFMSLVKRLASFDMQVTKSTVNSYPVDKLEDKQLDQLVACVYGTMNDVPKAEALLDNYKNRPRGVMALLRQMGGGKGGAPIEKIVQFADELQGTPEFAQKASMIKGKALKSAKQYQPAIAAFQQANQPPETAYEIAECLLLDGKLPQAIE